MDENLSAKFAGPKRKKKFIRGTGMEKPRVLDEELPEEELPENGMEIPPGAEEMSDIAAPDILDPGLADMGEEEPEEDDVFRDLVDRMEGASASAGRAAARRKLARKEK